MLVVDDVAFWAAFLVAFQQSLYLFEWRLTWLMPNPAKSMQIMLLTLIFTRFCKKWITCNKNAWEVVSGPVWPGWGLLSVMSWFGGVLIWKAWLFKYLSLIPSSLLDNPLPVWSLSTVALKNILCFAVQLYYFHSWHDWGRAKHSSKRSHVWPGINIAHSSTLFLSTNWHWTTDCAAILIFLDRLV